MEVIDQLQRKISLPNIPRRIISLVPSQTELLVDLGLEENILGITKFCVHPKHLRKNKTIVGGTKQVKLEKIKALDPDIILCNKEENTQEMVAELEEIAPVHVSDIVKIEDAFDLMHQYGEIFQKKALVGTMVNSIRDKIGVLQKQIQNKPIRKVAYFIWKKPLMVAGKDTFIDELLKLNKFENIFREARYPETTLEVLKDKNPDLILLSSEPFPFKEKHKEYFSTLNVEIKLVDGEYFSWYGSRLVEAIDYFKTLRD
ncbi:ABC transporter substrate-binding protein [Salegentibacter mishustinae]|uniref:Iron ABC transporter n=1 Tax=Salegentibacter mishustinae TaxID=270918 RepID=A0A0Q9ZPF6_9FLAO|nr:helical backbone metal receptor [Salegentibacter mishustinae]KRG30483.1 iron ABC transporter [Salegentibacter mishustinae]PNW23374.1 iron ABC transporter [Salegentibacter mishustinae]PZX66443.1 ABC-type Fe3+-hydroxamate transport system substrate-binding protein [Salegentibacter mishustinae]GGW82559.1 iron ABC transporter [Salegentibacter mishustinae]